MLECIEPMASGLQYYQEFLGVINHGQNNTFREKIKRRTLRSFLATESPLKIMKNIFLFHLKISFCYQDIKVFFFTFWSGRKTAWLER